MFRARVHHWLKVLHCASPTKSLHLLPGTCKPKKGTSVFCRSPTCKTPSCSPSNFTYTSWKETHRNNNHLTTTSPVKLSLCGVTHLPLETPFLPNLHQPAVPGFPDDPVAFSSLSINQFNLNSASLIVACTRVTWFAIMTR
ncbi:hypothetical protein ILYODFUR_022810 [Ilyodon furcidens]|uniref:Uncharacterized protein n=1 Tax=Ilyodon furcidens TaxID=33524 RepID=A0ABV0TM01_9TELE